jgi:hypothetical protein
VYIAPFQRLRTLRTDGGVAGCPVVYDHKLHFVNGHLVDPYLAVRLRAPVPLLALGSCVFPAPTEVLHASLSSAFFSLRQVVISSASGMNALQSLNTSGVHAARCSAVPCAKDGAGETVAGNKATHTYHRAKRIDRNSVILFWLSMFIG